MIAAHDHGLCMSSQENERLQSVIKKQKTEMAKLQATCEEQVRSKLAW